MTLNHFLKHQCQMSKKMLPTKLKFLARKKARVFIAMGFILTPILLYYELNGYFKTLIKVAKDILTNDINFSISSDPQDCFFTLFVSRNGEYAESRVTGEVFDLKNVLNDKIIPKTRFNK